MKIGLIDSGYGGLAFLEGIKESKYDYSLIMDKAFFPYGTKSKEFLIKRVIYLAEYLFNYKRVDRIILACNTLSILTLPFLKLIYQDKITGVIELLDGHIKNNSIFLGTSASTKYLDILCYNAQVLINKIENKEEVKDIIKDLCENELKDYQTIILGCTHFLRVKEEFRKYKEIIAQDELYKISSNK